MYINKKTKPFSRSFSAFSPFQPFLIKQVSLLQPFLRLLVAASLNKTLKTHKTLKSAAQPTKPSKPGAPTNPQSSAHPQTLRARRTHKPSESGALTTSNRRRFFSSNPLVGAAPLFYSILNRWRTHNLKSEALHLFPDDSAALLLFHSKSVAPPTIFRFSLYI